MVHAHLAYAYYAHGKMDEAQVEFQKTLILDPRASTINYNIGVIHYNRNEYALARQSLLAELKIKPPYKPAHRKAMMGSATIMSKSWRSLLNTNTFQSATRLGCYKPVKKPRQQMKNQGQFPREIKQIV